jgi:methylated-DNA-[protein]-cysteine S-methyltransferase
MAKSAAKTDEAFDAVMRLGDLAPQAPTNLRDIIHLGIRLTASGEALDEIAWLVSKPRQTAKASVCARREPLLETIRQQLIAWFADPIFTFDLPLAEPRTAFQARLRNALCVMRSGETLTYGDLAKQLHSAPRAVGQALGSNPIPIIVPCHRIISAGKNRLTGFAHTREGPKITLKAWLLELEARA